MWESPSAVMMLLPLAAASYLTACLFTALADCLYQKYHRLLAFPAAIGRRPLKNKILLALACFICSLPLVSCPSFADFLFVLMAGSTLLFICLTDWEQQLIFDYISFSLAI